MFNAIRRRLNLTELTYIALSMLGRILNIVTMLIAVTRIGSRNFGVFSFVQVTAITAATFLTLSITTSLNVVLASSGSSENGKQAASFCLLYVSCAAFLLCPIFFVPDQLIHGLHLTLIIRTALYLFAVSAVAQNVFQGWLFGFARTTYVAAVTLGASFVSLIVILATPRGHENTLLTAYGLGAVATAFMMGLSVYRSSGVSLYSIAEARRFAEKYGKMLASYGAKSILNSAIFQLGLWRLQARVIATSGPVESAHFALGAQFYNIIVFIPTLIIPLLLNRLGRLSDRPIQVLKTTMIAFALCTGLSILVAGSYLVGFPLLSRFMPSAYRDAAPAIFWAVSAGLVLVVKAPLYTFFQSTLRVLPETVSVTTSAVALMCASFFLPKASAAQAAEVRMGALFIQLVITGLFFLYACWRLNKLSPRRLASVVTTKALDIRRVIVAHYDRRR